MKNRRGLQWILPFALLLTGGRSTKGDDGVISRPVLQVSFDHLIPTSFPTRQTSFVHLRPTTRPLIHPGVAQVPITENLINAFAQPLLIVHEGATVFPATTLSPSGLSVRPAPAVAIVAVPVVKSDRLEPRARALRSASRD